MKLFREPLSDDQHIERIRKSVSFVDRYSYWTSAFYLSLLLAGGWIFWQFIMTMINMPAPFPNGGGPNLNAWVWSGFVFGTIIGLGFAKFAHNMIVSIMMPFTGLRTEKLLLKYHDQIRGIEVDDFAELPDDNPFQSPSRVPEPETVC